MFSEHKKKEEAKKKELIFDELEAKTRELKVTDDSKKEKKGEKSTVNLSNYISEMDSKTPKRRSIKKSEQKASSMSLNLKAVELVNGTTTSQRSNSLESPGLVAAVSSGSFSIFDSATMMRNIVDITTDSTNKRGSRSDKSGTLKSKKSKLSIGSANGPFSQMKEAQEQKRKNKHSFDDDEE